MNVYGDAMMDAKRETNGKVVSIALRTAPSGPTPESGDNRKLLVELVAGAGFEPATFGLTTQGGRTSFDFVLSRLDSFITVNIAVLVRIGVSVIDIIIVGVMIDLDQRQIRFDMMMMMMMAVSGS